MVLPWVNEDYACGVRSACITFVNCNRVGLQQRPTTIVDGSIVISLFRAGRFPKMDGCPNTVCRRHTNRFRFSLLDSSFLSTVIYSERVTVSINILALRATNLRVYESGCGQFVRTAIVARRRFNR